MGVSVGVAGWRGGRARNLRSTAALAALLALAGCAVQPPAPPAVPAAPAAPAMELSPVGFDALPGWGQDRPSEALGPFLASCAAMGSAKLGGAGTAQTLGGTADRWQAACAAARSVPRGNDAAARAFFEAQFQPYAVMTGGSDTGLITGYYEPEMRGARKRAEGYTAPLLARPHDLVVADLGLFADDLKGKRIRGRVEGGSLVPYHDRAAIERGALAGQHLELVWLADPIDAFFVQIQGSGRVKLADGEVLRVSYADENGRPYVPIGKVLIEQGAIPREQVSMQSIRAWLEAHPQAASSVMDRNPSFVFFRTLEAKADQGPPGASGAALTPMRSAAVDRAYIPMGAPLFVDTTDAVDGTPIQRLVLAQDTGGAIKGPIRADLFFGWTAAAADHAGRMRQQGRIFILLPRQTGA